MNEHQITGDRALTHDVDDSSAIVYPTHASHYAGLAEAPVMASFDKLAHAHVAKSQDWDHWRALRRKFLDGGLEALSDLEILEVFLAMSSPRPKRHRQLAQDMIGRFGNLAGVVHANPRHLMDFPAETRRASYLAIALLKCVHVASVRLLRRDIVDRPIISSSTVVLNYCMARLSRLQHEELHILFLNRKNMMILEEVQQRGTIDHVTVYPREIARRCLDLGASAIIMVHNHPSGDPTPSTPDIEMTRQIALALEVFDIAVHDHLIIGLGRYASMRELGHY